MTWYEIFILLIMVMGLFAIDMLVSKFNLKAGCIVAVLTFFVLFPLGMVAGIAALICMRGKGKQRKFSITALFRNDLFQAFLLSIVLICLVDVILLKIFPDAKFPVIFLSICFSSVIIFLIAKALDYLKEKARKPKTINFATTSKNDSQKQKNITATSRPSTTSIYTTSRPATSSSYATPQDDPYAVSDDYFLHDPDYQDYLQGNIRPSRYVIERKVAANGQEYTTLKSEQTELAAFYREQNEKGREIIEPIAASNTQSNDFGSAKDWDLEYATSKDDLHMRMIGLQGCKNLEEFKRVRPDLGNQITETATKTEEERMNEPIIPTGTTEIREREFEKREDIISVVIPESVIKIGEYAFCVCKNLKSVVIAEGVKEIGSHAFRYCENLESVVIPNSVTKIGVGAFSGCKSLINVNIPKSIDKIADSLFSGCEKLSSLVIHYKITDIGQNAFADCTNLSSIVIPDSVSTIGQAAFCRCAKLTSVKIPKSIKEIGASAFSNCENLTEVTVKSTGVTRIGNYAFKDCPNLSSVKLHEGVISIGVSAFGKCDSLYSVVIPDSVVWLGSYAFEHCVNLTHVALPNKLNSMGDYVFLGCENLNSIDIPENIMPDLCSNGRLSGCLALKSFKIPYGVTEIAYNMFSNCENLTTVEIPNTVELIGNHAFSGCKNLEHVNIPNSVKTIGEDAFAGCDKIGDNIKRTALSKIPRIVPVTTSYNTPYDDPQCDDNFNPDKYNYELRVAGNGQEYYARIN